MIQANSIVREVFSRARKATPSIIFFDEIDSMVGNRSSGDSDGTSVPARILSSLLNEMDGIEVSAGNVLIIGATNQPPSSLDRALVRAGRFDRLIYVPSPQSEEERVKILEIHTKAMSLADDVDLVKLARIVDERFTGADLRGWCREAAMGALREDMDSRVVVCLTLSNYRVDYQAF
jgi:ATP-dependent 26S proteasome regulatory subunit